MANKLSLRLQTIFDQLRPGLPVWDLCCDHGLLGLAALSTKNFQSVHFVDQLPHAIDRLERQCRANSRAYFYSCPCENLSSVLDGNIVIAGIGSERMLNILQTLERNALLRPSVLVLGPQKNEGLLADFLRQKESSFSIKVLEAQEGHRQRRIYVLNLVHDSRVD